tara:strand:+ start:1648 stop:1845 length:198 start_codon:yes stop_codon:yes gene_type:complete
MQNEPDYIIVKKIIHGVEVDVKLYPLGLSNYIEEDDLDALIEEMTRQPEPTVQKTGIEHYLRSDS